MYIAFFITQNTIEGDIDMIIANLIAYILVLVGALNWGLVGIFNWNLVEAIFMGFNAGSRIVYILVAIAAIWLIIAPFLERGKLTLLKRM